MHWRRNHSCQHCSDIIKYETTIDCVKKSKTRKHREVRCLLWLTTVLVLHCLHSNSAKAHLCVLSSVYVHYIDLLVRRTIYTSHCEMFATSSDCSALQSFCTDNKHLALSQYLTYIKKNHQSSKFFYSFSLRDKKNFLSLIQWYQNLKICIYIQVNWNRLKIL